MRTSQKGLDFITRQEGCPLTAYLDPVGIPTIAHGFTLRSPAVKRELANLGIHKLIPGKTKLTQEQADDIFGKVLASEFEKAVNDGLPDGRKVTQEMYDAMVSATWNLGPKFMTWKWKTPWARDGDKHGSAVIWGSNYNTAAGKKLPGLVRRRIEEATLFEDGVYAGTKVTKTESAKKPVEPDNDVTAAQENLNKVGIPVEVDGWLGPRTTEAIKKYQAMHPHLKVDGILGAATITQLSKDASSIKDVASKSGIATAVGSAVSAGAGIPVGWIVGIAVVVAIGAAVYFGWKYRDVLECRWNRLRGKECNHD